ncbi:Glycosyltransferase involved in cell wall bisynthesis [Algibacter lectus]|uniref:glycosyltransferase family 2 protein n=1 Tax=Algibacter lectus TaxID=221126 RepID=UPI0008E8A38F|nr:glycosyltransferase family 2 protein [Algibacter lectus]SFD25297.1 Glycosyltransferase involved in cell wall bisynthesis [Algibacter lectus]
MISIIIPIYNRQHLIEETLNSIKAQTYANWECIIVDDGSTDNTYNITNNLIKGDNRFQLYNRPLEFAKGPSSCRNFAITKMSGNYIQFFDSDDVMHPNHLQLKIEAIKTHDFVICQLQEFTGAFDTNLFSSAKQPYIKPSKNVFEDFTTGTFPMLMVAPLWKASSLKPYLPIREDLHILEDHELYARALSQDKTYAIINIPLIFYRVGSSSSTNSFYSNVSYGLASYFEAKKTVLHLSSAKPIKLAILKMTLGFFRLALAERDFKSAQQCLNFIKNHKLAYSFKLKVKLFRIIFFYSIFKIVKKGDTKFKPLFKL